LTNHIFSSIIAKRRKIDFNELLQIAREFLSCPVCGEHFDSKNIHFRGFIDDKFVIQTECSKKHNPVNALFISSVTMSGKPIFDKDEIVTVNDVLDLKNHLQQFDGDFERIFQKGIDGPTNTQSQNPNSQGQES